VWEGFEMDRGNQGVIVGGIIIGVLVLATFSVGMLPPFIDPPDPPSFKWAVHTNDTLTYQVTVYRIAPEAMPGSEYEDLNHTIITLNITSLVDVQEITNETQFTLMVETEKTAILLPVLHENGSEVDVHVAELVENIVSKSILPVDGWSFVDYSYSDLDEPIDYGFSCDTYFSYTEPDSFVFGHVFYLVDWGFGWHSTINTTNGLPSHIDWWFYDALSTESYQIIITLIP
jgi:hypothetical protein